MGNRICDNTPAYTFKGHLTTFQLESIAPFCSCYNIRLLIYPESSRLMSKKTQNKSKPKVKKEIDA